MVESRRTASVAEFLAAYPDDDACLDHIWRYRFSADGKSAPCDGCRAERRFHRVSGRRSYSCDSCGHHVYPTAGTILHRSRVPLQVWFHAAFLVGQGGTDPSIKQLQHQLGVNYKTAARMVALLTAEFAADAESARPSGLLELVSTAPARARRADVGAAWDFGEVHDVAGNGLVFMGEGGPAVDAALGGGLHGIACDASGLVYMADSYNHVVRMVDVSGTISTVAGCGSGGYSGDGGPAVRARMLNPSGVALDGDGALLIADTGNHVVRRVDHAGTISTIAGVGVPGHTGDGGPARTARLNGCYRVLVADDDLIVSEYLGNCVRRIDAAGTITTIAGNGSQVSSGDGGVARHAGVPRPVGLAMDRSGILYVAQGDDEPPNSRVRMVIPDGTIATLAGTGDPGFAGDGGPAARSWLHNPVDVAVDHAGGVLISDFFNHRVRRVGGTGVIQTAVENLCEPIGLAVGPDGDLFVVDSGNNRVRKVAGGPQVD